MPVPEGLPAAPGRLDTMFTPGQRWSTAVILTLAIALALAQPSSRVTMAPSASAQTAGAPASIDVPPRSAEELPVFAAVDAPVDSGIPAADIPLAPIDIPPAPPPETGPGEGEGEGEAPVVTCEADAALPTPIFAPIVAQLRTLEAAASTTAGQPPPASAADQLAAAAGCSDAPQVAQPMVSRTVGSEDRAVAAGGEARFNGIS